MNKTRLEAFSDGVIAILITIMVLEMKVPHGADFAALRTLWPVFLSYVLSFVYLGIYWNNHPPLDASGSEGGWAGDVGEFAPLVLVVVVSFRDGLERAQSFRGTPRGPLWGRHAGRRCGLFHPGEMLDPRSWSRLSLGQGGGSRRERNCLSPPLCRVSPDRLFSSLACLCCLCVGGASLVRSRPSDGKSPEGSRVIGLES